MTTSISRPSLPPRAHTTDAALRPQLPRRSSSLHKAVLTRLRPLPFQYIYSAWHSKPNSISTPTPDTSPQADPYVLTQLVETVPDIAAFYRIFNNVPWCSIRQKESIHFFRSGVKPLWEDPENIDGGCLVLKFRKEDGRALRLWEEVCLMVCGGALQAAVSDERDHVLGMSYSPRLYWSHISIWTKHGSNARSVEKLKQAILFGLSAELRPRSDEYYFKKHSDHTDWSGSAKP